MTPPFTNDAFSQARAMSRRRLGDRNRTLMRHTRRGATSPIGALAPAMCLLTYFRRLVATAAAKSCRRRIRCRQGSLQYRWPRSQLRHNTNTALQSGLRHLRGRRPSKEAVRAPATLATIRDTRMIGRMMAPGRDDVARRRRKVKKRRFLMIAYMMQVTADKKCHSRSRRPCDEVVYGGYWQ